MKIPTDDEFRKGTDALDNLTLVLRSHLCVDSALVTRSLKPLLNPMKPVFAQIIEPVQRAIHRGPYASGDFRDRAGRKTFVEKYQHAAAQRFDSASGLAQPPPHPAQLRSGQPNMYGHRRGTSLVSGLLVAKPFYTPGGSFFDPTSVQAI